MLEVLVVALDFRVFRVGQRRLEARVFHELPGGQFDAPGLGQPFLVAVLVTQLLEEGALGRYIGGQAQSAVGQAIPGFRVAAWGSPGQLVVGEVADQPRVVTVITGGNGHGALGGHGETRVERVGHAAPPVHAGADAGVITHDRQRQGVGHTFGLAQGGLAPVADRVETPGHQTVQRMRLPAGSVQHQWRAVGGLPFCGRRAGFAVGTLHVGSIKVEPAPLFEVAPLRRGIAIVVVALTVECGQCIALAR
ncbi:hypothetical protein D3C76_1019790 [compost metagenome]